MSKEEAVTDPIRVVVWSTGGVGSVAVDGIRHRPDLKLVGVWVHSPDKVGKDAGELVGGDPIGLAATHDADALIALKPDCAECCQRPTTRRGRGPGLSQAARSGHQRRVDVDYQPGVPPVILRY